MRTALAFIALVLAGCGGPPFVWENPTKTHAEYSTDIGECNARVPVRLRGSSYGLCARQHVARCMESRGWHLKDGRSIDYAEWCFKDPAAAD